MDKRAFKDKVYTLSAKLIQAMANPRRLEIIDLLGQGERSVEEIARETAMSVANSSQHLQVLKQSNLVQQIGRASCREKCVSTCRSRWSPYHYKTTYNTFTHLLYLQLLLNILLNNFKILLLHLLILF